MKESFFGKQYDIPAGMSPKDFNEKLLNFKGTEERRQIERSPERFSPAGMLLETKRLIEGISLKPEFSNEENRIKLEERKLQALKLLDDLVRPIDEKMPDDKGGYIAQYASSINQYNKANIFGNDRNVEEFIRFDSQRRLAHDALMAHVRATIRNIFEQFSVMSEDDLDDVEERLTLRVEQQKNMPLPVVLPVERVKFPSSDPKKIFLPKYANLDDRDTITRWAEALREGLSKRTHST